MRGRLRYLVAAALIAAFPLLGVNVFYLQLAQQVAFVSIAALGLNLLIGLSGQLSLGHMGFYAIGGYGSAILATTYGWPLWASALAGLLVAAIIGGLVGIVALRARSHYLAMATLAFGYMSRFWRSAGSTSRAGRWGCSVSRS
jgi:ABC-type branched-subunit amino acid transport system permease subunit